jgi:hypothetical protein
LSLKTTDFSSFFSPSPGSFLLCLFFLSISSWLILKCFRAQVLCFFSLLLTSVVSSFSDLIQSYGFKHHLLMLLLPKFTLQTWFSLLKYILLHSIDMCIWML